MPRTPAPDLEALLTIQQVAELENVSPKTIRRRIEAGALPAIRNGLSADGQLYAAGGFEWSGQLTTAEVYDARADRWRPLPDLVDGGAVIEFCAGAAVWA